MFKTFASKTSEAKASLGQLIGNPRDPGNVEESFGPAQGLKIGRGQENSQLQALPLLLPFKFHLSLSLIQQKIRKSLLN